MNKDINLEYFYAPDDSFTDEVNLNIEPISNEPMTEEEWLSIGESSPSDYDFSKE